MPFQITPAAAREVLDAAVRSDAEGMALRVAAKQTESGMVVGMGFDDEAPGDEVLVFEGLTVVVAPSSRPWLADTLLDFGEVEGGARDFIFIDAGPAASDCATGPASCGSGGCSSCS